MDRLRAMRLGTRGCLSLLGLFGVALLSPFRLGVVSGHSMAPTFQSGSLYVMARSSFVRGPLRRGDIVVFDEGGTTYIKRVLATEGDRVALYKERNAGEAEVIRDWQLSLLEKAVVKPWQRNMQIVNYRVPMGCCYVVGDNLNQSVDSRSFGAVPVSAIRGRVLFSPLAESEEETHLCVNPINERS